MGFPSIKTISSKLTYLDKTQVKTIRGLIDGTLDPEETSPKTLEWVESCYYYPAEIDRIMHAINAIMDTHGVEPVFDSSGMNVEATYCNTGETYTPTVLYDYVKERFLITSWGDFYESIS